MLRSPIREMFFHRNNVAQNKGFFVFLNKKNVLRLRIEILFTLSKKMCFPFDETSITHYMQNSDFSVPDPATLKVFPNSSKTLFFATLYLHNFVFWIQILKILFFWTHFSKNHNIYLGAQPQD